MRACCELVLYTIEAYYNVIGCGLLAMAGDCAISLLYPEATNRTGSLLLENAGILLHTI